MWKGRQSPQKWKFVSRVWSIFPFWSSGWYFWVRDFIQIYWQMPRWYCSWPHKTRSNNVRLPRLHFICFSISFCLFFSTARSLYRCHFAAHTAKIYVIATDFLLLSRFNGFWHMVNKNQKIFHMSFEIHAYLKFACALLLHMHVYLFANGRFWGLCFFDNDAWTWIFLWIFI